MDFLSNLHTDVKLLLVASALALFAALVSGSKKKEHRYMAMFALLMVVAGYRFRQEGVPDATPDQPDRQTAAAPARNPARTLAR